MYKSVVLMYTNPLHVLVTCILKIGFNIIFSSFLVMDFYIIFSCVFSHIGKLSQIRVTPVLSTGTAHIFLLYSLTLIMKPGNFKLHCPGTDHVCTGTVRYARTNVIGSRSSFVIASVRSSIH